MEEILASIRRIIADDDQQPVRRPAGRRDDPTAEMRRPEAPRPDAGRAEPARPAAPRPDTVRGPVAEQRMQPPSADRGRHETDYALAPRMEMPRLDAAHADHFGIDTPRTDAPRAAPVRQPEARRPEGEAPRPTPRPEPQRAEALRPETVRVEPPHSEPVRYGTQRPDAAQPAAQDVARPAPRPVSGPVDGARGEYGRLDPVRPDGRGSHVAPPEAVHTAVERAVAETRSSQDAPRFFGHDSEPAVRHLERDEAVVQPRPVPLRAESAPEAARPIIDARSTRPSAMPDARRKDLLSPAVDAAVMAAFESLGDVSLGQTALPEQGRTVEDLIKEILRPMLKTWLDDHLPDIVERLVRAEIERVARNGR